MACAYVEAHPADATVGTVFTVHNLAYQGLFPPGDFHLLEPAVALDGGPGLEFHGQLAFMKAGPEVRRPRDHRQPDLRPRDRDARSSATGSTA